MPLVLAGLPCLDVQVAQYQMARQTEHEHSLPSCTHATHGSESCALPSAAAAAPADDEREESTEGADDIKRRFCFSEYIEFLSAVFHVWMLMCLFVVVFYNRYRCVSFIYVKHGLRVF